MKEVEETDKAEFLSSFIKDEKYLFNPPVTASRFVSAARDRGIRVDLGDLEFLEKSKLLFPLMRIDLPVRIEDSAGQADWMSQIEYSRLPKTERNRPCRYSSYGFGDGYHSLLVGRLDEGLLYDPTARPFRAWAEYAQPSPRALFDSTVTFYSTYQLAPLKHMARSGISGIGVLRDAQESAEVAGFLKDNIHREVEKSEPMIEFLLSIQAAFYPLACSGAGRFQIHGDDEKWWQVHSGFDCGAELERLGLTEDDIVRWYCDLAARARRMLGADGGRDWLQLWKAITWDRKDKLRGSVRLGIDYLTWALMVKKFLERLQGEEILDVDEVSNLFPQTVLAFRDISTDVKSPTTRALRNRRHVDPEDGVNYYNDSYKRGFYLANKFGLDYQPRVVLFVEGRTEEEVFKAIFDWLGYPATHLGVHILPYNGVGRMFGAAKFKREKERKVLVSNLKHLVSYNLTAWQILPFATVDGHGPIAALLRDGEMIDYRGEQFPLPRGLTHVFDPDFELANFQDSDIAHVVSDVTGTRIESTDVVRIRAEGKGIKALLSPPITGEDKVEIGKRLFESSLRSLSTEHVAEMPVVRVARKVLWLTSINHMPVDRQIELINRDQILRWLRGEEPVEPPEEPAT